MPNAIDEVSPAQSLNAKQHMEESKRAEDSVNSEDLEDDGSQEIDDKTDSELIDEKMGDGAEEDEEGSNDQGDGKK